MKLRLTVEDGFVNEKALHPIPPELHELYNRFQDARTPMDQAPLGYELACKLQAAYPNDEVFFRDPLREDMAAGYAEEGDIVSPEFIEYKVPAYEEYELISDEELLAEVRALYPDRNIADNTPAIDLFNSIVWHQRNSKEKSPHLERIIKRVLKTKFG